jgi:hypothetical protein
MLTAQVLTAKRPATSRRDDPRQRTRSAIL